MGGISLSGTKEAYSSPYGMRRFICACLRTALGALSAYYSPKEVRPPPELTDLLCDRYVYTVLFRH